MSDFNTSLAAFTSRLIDQVWAIRDSSLQAYIADGVAGRLKAVGEGAQSGVYERQGTTAVFRVAGVMVPQARWFDEVSTAELTRALNVAAGDADVRSGVMLISSPGGMALGQIELEQAAAKFASAKPLVAHVEQCCCSAAYWLAAQATKIFAGPRDDIGSIGVRSLYYDWSKYFEEFGVEAVSTATGPLKDLGVLGKPITEQQRAFLAERVEYTMGDFKKAVTSGRHFDDEQFAAIADGRVWFGEQALGLGLIDGIHTHEQTFAYIETLVSKANSSIPKETLMSEQAEAKTQEPEAATLADLKKSFPNSTAEWREEQIEAGSTITDAAIAYAQFQESEANKAKSELAETREAAEKAAKTKPDQSNKSQRGVEASSSSPGDEEESANTDYRQMAKGLAKDKGITYRQACHLVQKEHGEPAREAFRAGRLNG